jgi:hypothetical protein
VYLSFSIPFLLAVDHEASNDGEYHKLLRDAKILCRDALMDIGLSKMFWPTCLQHVRNNTGVPDFGLKGRRGNIKERWNELYFDSLVEQFEAFRKEAGGPIATRFVRESSGKCTTTRDDNELAEYLSPGFSKRQCYYKYCLSRGVVKVTSNNRGNMLTEDTEGVPRLPIPSWGAYKT